MGNRAESTPLSNQTFIDRTAFEAIRNADKSAPKVSPINQSRTEPVTLFSANNLEPYTGENSQPRRITTLNQMSISQLDLLSAELRLKKLKGIITGSQYTTLIREIHHERQWKKRKQNNE